MKSRLLRSTFLFGMMLFVLTPITVDAETWTDHWAIIDIMEGETRTLYPTDAQISLMTQYDNEEVLSWSWTNYLLACFDEEVNETAITEIARQHPYYFTMCDSRLANDQVADNFEQI